MKRDPLIFALVTHIIKK